MIYINDKLRIRKLDDRNLQLEEYRKPSEKSGTIKENTEKWRWCGYYGDLKSALLGALTKQLFDSAENELTLKDIISRIDEARAEIITAIDKLKNS